MKPEEFLIPSPADLDNEAVVLCGMLRDVAAVAEMTEMLTAEDFSANGEAVFRAIVEVWEQAQARRVDPELVLTLLVARTKTSVEIWRQGLFSILESDPSAGAYHGRAQLVKERSIRRQLVMAAQDIFRDCVSPSTSADDAVSAAQVAIMKIGGGVKHGQTVTFAQAIREAEHAVNTKASGNGIPCGLVDVDALTGGFHAGELCIIAARPSVGKSALAMQTAIFAACDGQSILMLSLEMSRSELALRFLCGEAKVKSQHLRAGKLQPLQLERFAQAGVDGSRLPIWVNDSGTLRSRDIRAITRKAVAATGCKCVIIDYLQLITPEDSRVNRVDQVGEMSRSLKLLARDLSIPVICLAQLNRKVEERADQKPLLSDLRDSGNIEQDADTVIFLSRAKTDCNETVDRIVVSVAKQRNGPIGSVDVIFRKDAMRFENYCPGIPL